MTCLLRRIACFQQRGTRLIQSRGTRGCGCGFLPFWSAAALMGGSALQFCISFLPIDIIPSLTVEK